MLLLCTLQQFEYDTNLLVREFFPGEEIKRRNDNSDACLLRKELFSSIKDGEESLADELNGIVKERFDEEDILFTDYTDKTTTVVRYTEGKIKSVSYPIVLPANTETEETAEEDNADGETTETGIKDSETDKKKAFKQAHMHNLYLALRELMGKDLPWGSLTGVRPTKLARQKFLNGATDEEVRSFYREERFVSEEKSALAMEIAKREIDIISSCHPLNGYSLYIGIPFCPTRCAYCSFLSGSIDKWQTRVGEYLSCIEKELVFVKETFAGKTIDTVYIGGGTPTALSAEELRILTETVSKYIPVNELLEYTVEAGRPDSITEDKLKVLKEAGVSRISVNPQSMNDETLLRIGRRHTVSQILEAYDMARNAGFDNINMDMIIGLPGEGIEEVEKTVREIERLKPDSLTVHSLAMKRSSKLREEAELKRSGKDGKSANPESNAGSGTDGISKDIRTGNDRTDGDPVKMMEIAYEGAARLSLNPYYLYRQKNIAGNLENVGFAADGKYGIYNILMMEEVQTIVALGAGTVSKRVLSEKDISRCDTAKDIGLYMDGIDEMIERKRKLFL